MSSWLVISLFLFLLNLLLNPQKHFHSILYEKDNWIPLTGNSYLYTSFRSPIISGSSLSFKTYRYT